MNYCKSCGELTPAEYCRECRDLKSDLEKLLEEAIEVSGQLGLNVVISVDANKATVINWYRDCCGAVQTNEFFNIQEC